MCHSDENYMYFQGFDSIHQVLLLRYQEFWGRPWFQATAWCDKSNDDVQDTGMWEPHTSFIRPFITLRTHDILVACGSNVTLS